MKGAARLLCCSIPFGVLYVQSEGNGDGCHGDTAMTVLGVVSALPACAGDSVIRASPLCVLWFRNCAPGIRRPRFCSLNDRLARRPQANPCAVWAVVAGIPPASRLLLRRPQRFQCPDLDCSWQSVLREGLLSPLPHVKGELHLLGVMSCGVHSERCPKY